MKIIKSGKKTEPENRTGKITCKCGCEFEWEESDIFTEPAPYVVATYPPCYDEFEMVKCPECNQKYRVGIKYGRPAEGYAIQAQDWIDATEKDNDFSESKETPLQHFVEACPLNTTLTDEEKFIEKQKHETAKKMVEIADSVVGESQNL